MTHMRERRNLCIEAERLKERLFRAGLYLTGHKMDAVTKQIGYEVAALEQKQATARGERKER